MKRYLRKRNSPEGGFDGRKIKVDHRDQRMPVPSPLDILYALRTPPGLHNPLLPFIIPFIPPITTIDLTEEPNSESNPIEID